MKETVKLAPKPEPKPHALYWCGTFRKNGDADRFFAGVPTRDLTSDEVDALDDDLRRALITSGLYATSPFKGAKE